MEIHCDTTRYILEVLEGGEYSYLFDDLVVVDAGCNIGAFSIWISERARVVHAVDVALENIENLDRTIAANRIPNIKTHCLALAGRNGSRWVSPCGSSAGAGGYQIRDITGEGFEADGYTLATFMGMVGLDRIDILKLDVEGAELEILNAKDFPADKVSTIIGELHTSGSPEKMLKDMGYSYVELGSHFRGRR